MCGWPPCCGPALLWGMRRCPRIAETPPSHLPATDDPTAALALQAAKDQLTRPEHVHLDRADPDRDDLAAQQLVQDRATDLELRCRHTAHLTAGRHAQATRTLTRLRDHRARLSAATSATATTPSLLSQLRDAVTSTQGAGNAARGARRAPIGLAAAELLHTVQRAIRSDGADLAADVRAWAPADITAAATLAGAWVEQARVLLHPPRRWTHPGACPDCGHTTASVLDDTGQHVRRPALELDTVTGRARCLCCPARWTTIPQLRQLARVLEQQQAG